MTTVLRLEIQLAFILWTGFKRRIFLIPKFALTWLLYQNWCHWNRFKLEINSWKILGKNSILSKIYWRNTRVFLAQLIHTTSKVTTISCCSQARMHNQWNKKGSSITTRSPCFCVDRDQKAYECTCWRKLMVPGQVLLLLSQKEMEIFVCVLTMWEWTVWQWKMHSQARILVKNFLHGLLEIHGLQKLIWQSGYNQVELAEDSRDILAIATHAGLYKPTRIHFGPFNAPAHFQRSLEGLFAKLPGTRVYFDDCPTVGKKPLKSSWRRTLRHSSIAVRKLTSCWMHRNALLDHQFCLWLDVWLAQIQSGLIQIVLVHCQPWEHTSEQGGITFIFGTCAVLCSIHSKITREDEFSFWVMLKKNTVFEWTPNHQEAFENIKESIVNAPILAQFIPGEPITIRPDFSSISIGGVVLQGLSQNQKPLLFYGRKLSPAETRYSTIESEWQSSFVHSAFNINYSDNGSQ